MKYAQAWEALGEYIGMRDTFGDEIDTKEILELMDELETEYE